MPLTSEQRREVERQFLNAGAWEAFGLESQLARRLGISQTTIHQVKAGLYGRRMFFSRRYGGFIGMTSDGRLFRVEQGAWGESVNEGVKVDSRTREEAEETNLDPANWEPCIDENPGVRRIERATRPSKKLASSPIPLRMTTRRHRHPGF